MCHVCGGGGGAGSSGREFARDRVGVRRPCGWSRALAVRASCHMVVRARGDFPVVALAAPLDPHARGGTSLKRRALEDQHANIATPCGAVQGTISGGEHKRCQGTITYSPDADAASAQAVLVRASGRALSTRVHRRASRRATPSRGSPAICSAPPTRTPCRVEVRRVPARRTRIHCSLRRQLGTLLCMQADWRVSAFGPKELKASVQHTPTGVWYAGWRAWGLQGYRRACGAALARAVVVVSVGEESARWMTAASLLTLVGFLCHR